MRRLISLQTPLADICENLITKCLAPDSDWGGVGCDNMTILVVAVLHGRTKEEWYSWVTERVLRGDAGDADAFRTPTEFADPFAQGPRGNAGDAGDADIEEDASSQQQLGGVGGGGSVVAQMLRDAIKNGTIGAASTGASSSSSSTSEASETSTTGDAELLKTSLSPPQTL